MKPLPLRSTTALLCLQMLLSACSATAHAIPHATWPEPAQPQGLSLTPVPVVTVQPNFQAPSASHCARPIQTREVPGAAQQHGMPYLPFADMVRRESPAKAARETRPESAPPVALAAPAVDVAMAGSPATTESRSADMATAPIESVHPSAPRFAPPRQAPVQSQPPQQTVTAGMVDDNANFSDYLAFRQRTQVAHRARDVSERYLLDVRDARGQGVPDAEVVVQSSSGHAMWARTDAAGKVWLHPNAFDPSQARLYDVAVRKNGHLARAVLQRGQKSAVEVKLGGALQPARAQLDLVFLIDATGSMGDEIGKLKATLQTIAGEVAQLPSRPDLCFGLVAYRDKGDQFLLRSHDLTNDLNAFQGVLNALQAGGGGDYPEAMNEALHDTVHKLSWRGNGATRLVFLLADAPPHLDYGGPQYDDNMLAALGKGIKIFGVGASGLDPQGEFVQRQIAQYTGGRFVFLTYANARRPSSGPGRETVHDVKNYSVDTLDRLIVRLVRDELGQLPPG